jgi:hypothetical protein
MLFSWKSRNVVIEWLAFRFHIMRTQIQISACCHWIVLNREDFQRTLCEIIYGLELVCMIWKAIHTRMHTVSAHVLCTLVFSMLLVVPVSFQEYVDNIILKLKNSLLWLLLHFCG